ncbi:MAG TPA: hypothetical protein VGP85_15860, partial [Pyrinomonadaceae bacterium]|nr:hypothetical protein [Pyrinomonadaceae bacterium]
IVPCEGPEFKHYVFVVRRTLVCRDGGSSLMVLWRYWLTVRNPNNDRLKFVGHEAGTEVDNSQSDS